MRACSCLHTLLFTSGCAAFESMRTLMCVCVGPAAADGLGHSSWWLPAALSFLSEWVHNPSYKCSNHTVCLHLFAFNQTHVCSQSSSAAPSVYLISLCYKMVAAFIQRGFTESWRQSAARRASSCVRPFQDTLKIMGSLEMRSIKKTSKRSFKVSFWG